MSEKRVYLFGNGKAEGRADMRNLLGGKGANLAEMTNLGLPVPQGFPRIRDKMDHHGQQDDDPQGLDGPEQQPAGSLARAAPSTMNPMRIP